MKKILAVFMAAMLLVASFAGCSSEEAPEAEAGNDTSAVVLRIGNTDYTLNEVNFMYVSSFNDIYNYYYSSGYNVVDMSVPLDEQFVDETTTWHQYVLDYTINSLEAVTGVYEKAVAEGYVLPEEYRSALDGMEQGITEAAAEYDLTMEEYIELNYGEGMDFATVYKMNEMNYTVGAYAQDYQKSIVVSDEDINAYYEANKNTIDTIAINYSFIYYEDEAAEKTEETKDLPTKEEALARAEALCAAKTPEEFREIAFGFATEEEKKAFEGDEDPTYYPAANYGDFGTEEMDNWLFDEARVAGETHFCDNENYGFVVAVMFNERIDPDYDMVDVRHILIAPEKAEGEKEATEEAWTAAEEKANEVLGLYAEGEQTEEAFAELAKEYSADSNAAQGGIYENVYKGQMVASFEDWCFDPARQPGDTEIVETVYGYHIMYFVGLGDNNLVSLIEPTIVSERYSIWAEECANSVTTEKLEGFNMVGGMVDEIYAGVSGLVSDDNSIEIDITDIEEKEKASRNASFAIIAVLLVVIVICIVIIVKKSGKKNNAEETSDDEASEEEEDASEAITEEVTEEIEELAEESAEASEEETEEIVEESEAETEEIPEESEEEN